MQFNRTFDSKPYATIEFPSIVDVKYHALQKNITFKVVFGKAPEVVAAEILFHKDLSSEFNIDTARAAERASRKLVHDLYKSSYTSLSILLTRKDNPSATIGWPWTATYVVDQPFNAKVRIEVKEVGYNILANLYLQKFEDDKMLDYCRLAFQHLIDGLHHQLSFTLGLIYFAK
jgi:hypothetical protein